MLISAVMRMYVCIGMGMQENGSDSRDPEKYARTNKYFAEESKKMKKKTLNANAVRHICATYVICLYVCMCVFVLVSLISNDIAANVCMLKQTQHASIVFLEFSKNFILFIKIVITPVNVRMYVADLYICRYLCMYSYLVPLKLANTSGWKW